MNRRVQSRRRFSRERDSRRVGGNFNTQPVAKVETSTVARTVFADIETGGLELHVPIIQIAAIAVDAKLNELEQFEVKVRFDETKACPDALRKIHYRRAEWKRSAVPVRKAGWSFAKFLRGHASVEMHRRDLSTFLVAQLACHNSEFDGPFLKAWFERLGIFMPASYRVFCTLQRAYWHFHENPHLPLPDDYRLGTLCQYFGVPLNPADAHEALADVRATVALYRALSHAGMLLESGAVSCQHK